MKRSTRIRLSSLAFTLLLTSGCMLGPVDEVIVADRTAAVEFWGFHLTPNMDIEIQAFDPTAKAWVILATTRSAASVTWQSKEGTDLYYWRRDTVVPAKFWTSGGTGYRTQVRSISGSETLMSVEEDVGSCYWQSTGLIDFHGKCSAPQSPVARLNSWVLSGDTVPGNVALGLASAPETKRNPDGTAEESECFDRVNAERTQRGLNPFTYDGDLTDMARSHSDDMQQRSYFSHGSSTTTTHRYQERGQFLGLKSGKFSGTVENIGSGYPNAATAVKKWMASPLHRAVILGEGSWSSYTHSGCGVGGSYWTLAFGKK